MYSKMLSNAPRFRSGSTFYHNNYPEGVVKVTEARLTFSWLYIISMVVADIDYVMESAVILLDGVSTFGVWTDD